MRAFTKILDAMGVTADADRVRIATLHLDAQADEWWEGMTRARRAETYTWDEFVRAFYVRFFPRATRQDLADRFQNLKQGENQSITDYHSRFIQLGRFAPQSVVADEPGMTWKFHKGLRPEYRIHLASHDHEQVELLKNAALKMETEYRSTHGTRPRQPGQSDRPGKRPQMQQHHSASHAPPPPMFTALPGQAYTAPPLQTQTVGSQKPRFPQDHVLVAGRPTIGWTGAHSVLALRVSLLLGPVSNRGLTSSRRTSRLRRFTPHLTCKRCRTTTLTFSSHPGERQDLVHQYLTRVDSSNNHRVSKDMRMPWMLNRLPIAQLSEVPSLFLVQSLEF